MTETFWNIERQEDLDIFAFRCGECSFGCMSKKLMEQHNQTHQIKTEVKE